MNKKVKVTRNCGFFLYNIYPCKYIVLEIDINAWKRKRLKYW